MEQHFPFVLSFFVVFFHLPVAPSSSRLLPSLILFFSWRNNGIQIHLFFECVWQERIARRYHVIVVARGMTNYLLATTMFTSIQFWYTFFFTILIWAYMQCAKKNSYRSSSRAFINNNLQHQ
jgi:hypothetical protein